MGFVTKSLTMFLGITACGLSGYLFYLFFIKEEEYDYVDHFPLVSELGMLEVKIPKDMIGPLIGRKGKNIKAIQEQSNVRIHFKNCKGSDDKWCVLSGYLESCQMAESLIQDFLSKQPVLESEDIWVPISCVGKIIGRCGEKITEIRSLSGAKITVNNFNDDDDDKGFTSKRITIKGTREQINVAKSLLEDIVEQALQSQQIVESSLAKREPRLPPKSPEIALNVDSPKVERISPVPGQPDSQFEVYVSAMMDPSRFWLQIVGPKATELDCLVEEMTDYYGKQENRSLHILNDIKKGDLVAAVFQYDSKWYRAEVLSVKEEDPSLKKAELYYVDYGDTDLVPCGEVYELRTDFLRLHFQAIECFLARVDPIGDCWSEEAVDKFEEWTHLAQWKKLSAKINGYSIREKTRAKREGSPVPGVDLFEISNEQDLDIAEELVKAGLAVFKKDADLRSNSRATSISNVSVASST